MRWWLLFVLVALSFVTDSAPAQARRGLVVFGGGETISHRADFEAPADHWVWQETDFEEPAIGYMYEYFAVFFIFDLATFEGQYVLYEGDRFIPLSEADLVELGTSADDLGKPFLYYLPSGWLAALLLVGGWLFLKMRELKTRTW